ncbi:MAG: glycosyltransferase [Bacteroidetes bacterium]|nr:glycosyltransferase [Bacteroidota bacterium]
MKDTVNTLLIQTFQDFEIVIVDDGSVDDTKEIIEQINSPKILYFKTENFGVAHARNVGIKQAKGKFVGFLDSDDKVALNHLQVAYNYLIKNNEEKILHLNYVVTTIDGKIKYKNTLPKKLPNDIFKGCNMHVNCIFIENETAQKHLFNESKELMIAEDWDFFIKLSVKHKIKLINQYTVFIIDHVKRSMRNFNVSVWEKRREALIQSLLADIIVCDKYSKKINDVRAHMNSLIALNSIIAKNKKEGLRFFVKSVKENPREIFTRRTLAIFKYLLR